ncbi:hypothetical protein Pfo_020018 [Paulownia fortunei]|nr:hypothetical protein Pfo_020018 [Paulownia fortunei]
MSGGAMAEDEIEYESDPEEAKLSLKMRRREASDDEEEEGGEIREEPLQRVEDSDGESEGAAAEYVDEEDYDLDEEYAEEIEEEEEVDYEESGGGRGEDGVKVLAVERAEAGEDGVTGDLMEEKKRANNDASEINDESINVEDGQHDGEKKEIEPYAVPTAGAFYMHDDRFRDNAGGRHRRMLGGRKLWESKDNRKWGHDKFEELTMQDRSYEEHRRGSRGRYRGRGRNTAADRGYAQGNRPREHANNSNQNNNNQNNAPKGVRGRGPRRYQPSFKNKEAPLTQNKQSGKSVEKPSYVSSVRTSEYMSNAEPHVVLPRKQVFASNLNIASPPFYPSGSSTKDNSMPNKRDVQSGSINRNGQPSVVGEGSTMPQSSGVLRGKNIVDSIGVDKLYIDDSHSAMTGKPANNVQMPLSGPSSINSTRQHLRGQGRGIASLTQMAYQPAVSNNQVNRVNPPNQLQTVRRNPGQNRAQSAVQASGQQFTQRVPSGSQASSPPKATGAVNAVESGELESPSESSKSKTALVPKGKGSAQGSGRGSFLYGGAQVMGASGNMGSGHGDQNFPAFLPVMQFGGQRPGGIGVPAVGMAFPGYVAQPQLGLGNSEMTWLPVLAGAAGAAGALGARYCPPYIAVDGSYHALPSGQMSSITAASSKENNATNVGDDWKPAQKPELANDDFGRRQKNPRRYTEMKFDQ